MGLLKYGILYYHYINNLAYKGSGRMSELKHKLTNDLLFKMLFVKYPDLLKRLVAELLGIKYDDIEQFIITNPEMPPETLGDKFCRLDINMTVNRQRVDIEIQVENEGNYPERSLFIWAKEFSTAIKEGDNFSELPKTIIISILGFNQFKDSTEFHSEFGALEVNRHIPLSDKFCLHFFELNKLPPLANANCGKELWLSLFNAKTEEDLEIIAKLEVPIMSTALQAYRHVAASNEFKEIERMRSKARHDEAQALMNAKRQEREHWQGVVADVVAEKDARIAELEALLKRQQ